MSSPLSLIQLRLGFANNSSSSHSLVVLPSSAENLGVHENHNAGNWQWDFFTLTSPQSKRHYLSALLFAQIRDAVGPLAATTYIEQLLGERFEDAGSIDHQSSFVLPVERDGVTIHEGFFRAFRDWLMQDHVVILGGNDNADEDHPSAQLGEVVQADYFPKDGGGRPFIADLDEDTHVWTLFSRETGAKVRIRFDDRAPLPEHVSNLPSSRPSLVDVKITDQCPFQCSYCYQASLPTGKPASLLTIARVATMLGKAGVMEVALGGGEPTLHPDFVSVLTVFEQNGIVPNFTTRNLAWLRKDELASTILGKTGSFAVSVDSLDEAKKAWGLWNDYHARNGIHRSWGPSKMSFQMVAGAVPQAELKAILKWATSSEMGWSGPPLTLLGYKDVGFGGQWRGNRTEVLDAQTSWVEMVGGIENMRGTVLRIDTALAESAREKLLALGISDRVFHTTEGSTSMYVDAVKGVMGASSYVTPHEMVPFDDAWLDQYRLVAAQQLPSPTIDGNRKVAP